ncbi:MAG: hypothetical protein AAFY71_00480 [Bacteroidota bacterium]
MSHTDDLREELEDAPFLKSLPNHPAFKVPEGYFEKMNAEMQDKLDDEEVLSTTPVLQAMERVNVFDVPQGYFEELPETISKKISEEKSTSAKIVNFDRRIAKPLMWVAAAALALLAAIYLRPQYADTQAENDYDLFAYDHMHDEAMYEVMEDAGIDSYDLMAALEEDEMTSLEGEMETDDMDFSDETLLDELDVADLEDMMLEL